MDNDTARTEWIQQSFGNRLRFLRGLAGLTQARLAERTGMTEEYVSKMERGLASPSFAIIAKLCDALDAAPVNLFLFAGPGDDPRPEAAETFARSAETMGTWEIDLETGRAVWSRPLFQLLGRRPRKRGLTLDTYLDSVHPEDRERLRALVTDITSTEHDRTLEYRLVRPDGTTRMVADHMQMRTDRRGNPTLLRGLVQDVTERRRLQDTLVNTNKRLEERIDEQTAHLSENLKRLTREMRDREAVQERYRNLFNHSPVALWIEDHAKINQFIAKLRRDGMRDLREHLRQHPEQVRTLLTLLEVTSMNQAALRLLRAPDLETLRRGLPGVATEDSLEAFTEHLVNLQESDGFGPAETVMRRTDGTMVRCQVKSIVLGSGEILVALTDITERAEAEDALRRSEARLNQAQRMARVGSYSLELATGRVEWSPQQYRNLGYEPHAVTPTAELFFSHVHPEDREACKQTFRRALAGNPDYENRFRVITTDGEVRHVYSHSRVMRDSVGTPLKVHGTTQDISWRQRDERIRTELVARLETDLRTLLAEAALAVNGLAAQEGLAESGRRSLATLERKHRGMLETISGMLRMLRGEVTDGVASAGPPEPEEV